MNGVRCFKCGKLFRDWNRKQLNHGTALPYLRLLINVFDDIALDLIYGSSGKGELTLHAPGDSSIKCETAYARRYQNGSKWKVCLFPLDHIYVRDIWEVISLVGPHLTGKPLPAPIPNSIDVVEPETSDNVPERNNLPIEANSISQIAHGCLSGYLNVSGRVIYSSPASIKPFPILLLGTNPGGDVEFQADETIGDDLESWHTKTTNAYLDESWGTNAPGNADLQRRVQWLLTELRLDVRGVPASNLIFMRSRRQAEIPFEDYADACWPINEAIIQTINPGAILAFGNGEKQSPYVYLQHKLGIGGEPYNTLSINEELNYSCKAFRTPDNRLVVGLPHLSRFELVGRSDVVTWIANLDGWPLANNS